MNEIVYRGESNQPLTNSKLVAEVFEKPHDNVLKAKGILPVIEQENTPSDKGTGGTEPAKAASASQQTINFN